MVWVSVVVVSDACNVRHSDIFMVLVVVFPLVVLVWFSFWSILLNT